MRRLPLVQHLLRLLPHLLRCLPVQGHLVPLAWVEGVVAGADAEGLLGQLLPERLVLEPPVREHPLPAWEVEAAVVPRQRRQHRACWARSSWWRTSAVLKRSATTHRLETELECYGHNNRGVGNPESEHGVRRIPYRCGVHLFTSVARLSGIR